ncbi:methyltransferase, putative [Bodo saltans]|uniref:Methyltransferase, putative n=1 Tax=Bodo saltans TaxID=75058 RepID=A0A0S4JFC3_BODSA|nr:methyltransferase, putative [Bodo saltans]|eukprot:CUG87685.1 methyltransferase, putative [Bodo saltans]
MRKDVFSIQRVVATTLLALLSCLFLLMGSRLTVFHQPHVSSSSEMAQQERQPHLIMSSPTAQYSIATHQMLSSESSKPLLVLITALDDPVHLSQMLFDVLPLRRCFDVQWVIVFRMSDPGLTRAPFFRDVFRWIVELHAYDAESQDLSHERNIGVQYALSHIVSRKGTADGGHLYFLDKDNALPNLCSGVDVVVASNKKEGGGKKLWNSSTLFYNEQLQCGKSGAFADVNSVEKLWNSSRVALAAQIACKVGAGSFLIPLTLLVHVRPEWNLRTHRCGIDPNYFASLITAQLSPSFYTGGGAAATVQRWPQKFMFDQYHNERGCVKAPWTQDILNATLAQYRALLRSMERSRTGLQQKKRQEQSHVAFHTHVHVLAALRRALQPQHRAAVHYLELGVWKGATSVFMSRCCPGKGVTHVIGVDSFSIPNQRIEAEWMRDSLVGENASIHWITSPSPASSTAVDAVRRRLGGNLLDMLFMNGMSATSVVMASFMAYVPLVASGGYIIFDDFMNTRFSPGVREAVWAMVQHGVIQSSEYDIIGTIPNVARAAHYFRTGDFYDWQDSLTSNEFIIRKR